MTPRKFATAPLVALAPLALAFIGCDAPQRTPPPITFCSTCDAANPLNASLLPTFAAARHEPVIAGARELCARLAVDVTGRPVSAADAEAMCAARDLEDVLVELQGTPEYLVVSERHWADRFQLNDIIGDWRSLKSLYAMVDELHKGELDYSEFAIRAMATPGLMTSDFEARPRVMRVFRSFMGRPASEGEQAELAGLFRAWLVTYEADPDFPAIYRYAPVIISGLCEPLARCSTTMFGGAALVFPNQTDYAGTPYDQLDDETLAVLRVPGELLTAQPTFAEAAADEILDRYLDWDEGNRDIRTPGQLFPEMRQVLADFIRDTGDYPAAERLVLTSWLYTQTTDVAVGEGVTLEGAADEALVSPAFVGPTKPMNAETWLAGLQHVTSYDLGACDNRYGDGFPYFLLFDAFDQGMIGIDEYNENMQRMFEMREDRGRLAQFDGYFYYDTSLAQYAQMLGGCPGFATSRQKPTGVSYAILQEGLAQAFCAPGIDDLAIPDGNVNARSVTEHLVPMMLSRPANDDDVLAITDALAGAGDVTDDQLISSACIAIAGSAEFLFR